jgi:RNA polymerase sigma-70 factor (ECF subfamily)
MPACGERNKNETDFKCLFDIYKNRLYGYVLTLTHSPYIAEEITQEIFIKLWLCRDTLGGLNNPEAYLFSMARNKTLNYLRKSAHESKILQELQSRMTPENNNVEEQSLLADQHKLLQEALTGLSAQRRLVYQLSRIQGLNHREIAAQLQVSPNTVKNHLVNALKFIRQHLNALNSVILCLLAFTRL